MARMNPVQIDIGKPWALRLHRFGTSALPSPASGNGFLQTGNALPMARRVRPQLNIQASDVVEMLDCFRRRFRELSPSRHLQLRKAPLQPLVSNRLSRPVTSNRCSTRPCSPFKHNVVGTL